MPRGEQLGPQQDLSLLGRLSWDPMPPQSSPRELPTNTRPLSADHLLTADPTDTHNLHSLSSIVDGMTVEDVSAAFPDESMPN